MLKKTESQGAALIDSMPQMAWSTNAKGQIDYCNHRCLTYTGLLFKDILAGKWKNLCLPDDLQKVSEIWKAHLESLEPFEIQLRIREYKTGHYRWNLCRAVPVFDKNGNVRQWVGTNTDIDDQKRAEMQLIAARNQAEEANRAKSEFMANMSHEIRTPLNAIMGLASILTRTFPLSDKQREFISTLQTSADSMLTLINDLLDISRIESHTLEFEKIPFDLARIIEEIMSMMKNESREKGLQLTMDISCIQDRILEGDPARLRQVILNLCSNAIKFTESGGIHIAADCQPVTKDGTQPFSISVTDTGVGISQDRLNSIFEKFVQGDKSINHKYSSTSLGLALTRTLAENMGGSISVKSEVGKGSTFTLSLELPVTDISRPEKFNHAADSSVNGQKILIVEDYAPNVLVAGSFLEDFGYHFDVATSGREAIDKIKDEDYKAVLMDVQMPGLNGLEATQAIRSYENLLGKSPLYIIGVTAHAMPGDRERCLDAGMNDYISKPFSPSELKRKLADLTAGQ